MIAYETYCGAWVDGWIHSTIRPTVSGDPSRPCPWLGDFRLVKAVDQAWATDSIDISYPNGFLDLVAIVALCSRDVLSWRLSNSLDSEFCLAAGVDRA